MTPLTVVCLFVKGEYPYTVEYVRRLQAMVTRWIDRPFTFVCLTDQPDAMPAGVTALPIVKLPNCFAYWTKLELFNPARRWPGRVLYLDLDTLIVSSLTPIIDYPAVFALIDDPPLPARKTTDAYKRQIFRRFNSSVMVWEGGTQTDLFHDWSPAVAARLSGDQDHIGERSDAAVGMPAAWFPRLSQVDAPPFHPSAKVILSKFPKNDVAVEKFPWFAPLWGAA